MIVQWPRENGNVYTVLDETWSTYTLMLNDRGSLVSVPIRECEILCDDPPPYDASV